MALTNNLRISHLLFIDDMLLFCDGSRRDAETLEKTLDLFKKATGMLVNNHKSCLTTNLLTKEEELWYADIFPFEHKPLDARIKYLGFQLKPNDYTKNDWGWLVA